MPRRRSKRFLRARPGLWTFCIVLSAHGFTPAFATFHQMAIQEVFVGHPGDCSGPLTPDQRSQYVMMRMWNFGQTALDNTFLRVEDASGNVLGSFATFTTPDGVANGGTLGCDYTSCPSVIIGTQAAKNLFTFSFDKLTTGQANRVALNPTGGRVCFVLGSSVVDCVAWGSFSCAAANCPGGPNTLHAGDFPAFICDTDFGVPAPALQFGKALTRTSFDCAFLDNASDFTLTFPHPINNLGANDNIDSDADGLINQLDCNDSTGTILWPPAEIQNVLVTEPTPGFAVISWDSQTPTSGSAVVYDIVRGTLSNLNGFSDASCYVADIMSPTTNDATPRPPGTGFYYLVRAHSSATCVGIYGTGASYAVLNPLCP